MGVGSGAMGRTGGVLLAAWVCAAFLPARTLFALHPALMAVGFGALMLEGMLAALALQPLAGKERVQAIKYHQVLMNLALACILVGFYAIYSNKERNGKPHFVSWHGLGGLATVVLAAGTFVGGLFSFRALGLMPLLPTFLQTRIKTIHKFAGAVTFHCGTASLISGFLRPTMARGATTYLWVLMTAVNAAFVVRTAVLANRKSGSKV